MEPGPESAVAAVGGSSDRGGVDRLLGGRTNNGVRVSGV